MDRARNPPPERNKPPGRNQPPESAKLARAMSLWLQSRERFQAAAENLPEYHASVWPAGTSHDVPTPVYSGYVLHAKAANNLLDATLFLLETAEIEQEGNELPIKMEPTSETVATLSATINANLGYYKYLGEAVALCTEYLEREMRLLREWAKSHRD
ncbi:hypothetical protein BV20DRAFT_1056890 [Pilatotrama ljubarskyi]|nr:hypothetical protein BV20DRAFT_1056890 [Pilatotrama ljubarskyi]